MTDPRTANGRETEASTPRVTRVTPECQIWYDAVSVIESPEAQRHLETIASSQPPGPDSIR
jgi:hypothetical protein